MLIAILGVSGAGKNVIINRLIEKWDIRLMPTVTTRPMRDNEFQCLPYVYMSKKKFVREQKRKLFFETCEVHKGIMYGTHKEVFEREQKRSEILIKDIDVIGVAALKKQGIDIVSIFVDVESKDELAKRLTLRGDSESSIKNRLSRWDFEMSHKKDCDYVVMNDILSNAVEKIEKIIESEAEKRQMKMNRNDRRDFIVVYNKTSGKGNSGTYARKICEKLYTLGNDVRLFHSKSPEDVLTFFQQLTKRDQGTAIVVGGDGTLSSCVHGIVTSGAKYSIAIYPKGTANDFASSIGMTKNIDKFIDMVIHNKPTEIDVANVNGYYAINAIGAGNFSHGGAIYSQRLKKYLGKFAYWLKCCKLAFGRKKQRLEVEIDGEKFVDDFLVFYVVNSAHAGGFKKFAPIADIHDGMFDFVGIKKCGFFKLAVLTMGFFNGIHVKSKKVVYKRGKSFSIAPVGNIDKLFECSDIDGNVGPKLPLKIRVSQKSIMIYTK